MKRKNSHTTIIKPQDAKVNKQSSKQLELHDEGHNHKYFIQLEILIGQTNTFFQQVVGEAASMPNWPQLGRL